MATTGGAGQILLSNTQVGNVLNPSNYLVEKLTFATIANQNRGQLFDLVTGRFLTINLFTGSTSSNAFWLGGGRYYPSTEASSNYDTLGTTLDRRFQDLKVNGAGFSIVFGYIAIDEDQTSDTAVIGTKTGSANGTDGFAFGLSSISGGLFLPTLWVSDGTQGTGVTGVAQGMDFGTPNILGVAVSRGSAGVNNIFFYKNGNQVSSTTFAANIDDITGSAPLTMGAFSAVGAAACGLIIKFAYYFHNIIGPADMRSLAIDPYQIVKRNIQTQPSNKRMFYVGGTTRPGNLEMYTNAV